MVKDILTEEHGCWWNHLLCLRSNRWLSGCKFWIFSVLYQWFVLFLPPGLASNNLIYFIHFLKSACVSSALTGTNIERVGWLIHCGCYLSRLSFRTRVSCWSSTRRSFSWTRNYPKGSELAWWVFYSNFKIKLKLAVDETTGTWKVISVFPV